MHQRDEVLHGQTVERHAAAVVVSGGDEQVAALECALRLRVEDIGLQDADGGLGRYLTDGAAGYVDLGALLLRVGGGGVDQTVEIGKRDHAHPQRPQLLLEGSSKGAHLTVEDRREGRRCGTTPALRRCRDAALQVAHEDRLQRLRRRVVSEHLTILAAFAPLFCQPEPGIQGTVVDDDGAVRNAL